MKITDSKQLGTIIRLRRKGLKLTQKDLAFTSGTGTRFISDLEKGKQTCEIGKVLIVLNSLGIRFNILNSDNENHG